MKTLFVGSEVMPFAAAGGLGDVLGSLPAALAKLTVQDDDIDIRVVMPLHSAVSEDWRRLMDDDIAHPLSVCVGGEKYECGVRSIARDGVKYYFIENERLFGREEIYGYPDDGARYAVFSLAVMELMRAAAFYPDILHANDWHSALCCVYMRLIYKRLPSYEKIRSVFTIHNIAYQGEFAPSELDGYLLEGAGLRGVLMKDGKLNFMRAGIECADMVLTVSPRYSREIKTAQYGHGLEDILRRRSSSLGGILNGIDYDYYNPEKDPVLAANYSAEDIGGKYACKSALRSELYLPGDDDTPLAAIISRLAGHKGIDLILASAGEMVERLGLQLVILGKGDSGYEEAFRRLEERYPAAVCALIEYDRELAKRLYAAADIFLMPSESEPCGLSQMIASRYGAIPVVRKTGGLYDSIKNYRRAGGEVKGNGFVFAEYSASALYGCVRSAVGLFHDRDAREVFVSKIMNVDFSWGASAVKYLEIYRELKCTDTGGGRARMRRKRGNCDERIMVTGNES